MSDPDLFKRRLGRFSISYQLLQEDSSIAQIILSTVVVVKAQAEYAYNEVQYIGLSHSFDIVQENDIIPIYEPIIKNRQLIRWERDE